MNKYCLCFFGSALVILLTTGFTMLSLSRTQAHSQTEMFLFNFQTVKNLSNWKEVSDTVRSVGKSKASFVLLQSQLFQRAIFFTLLDPQPNGAGFAGVRSSGHDFDLSDFDALQLRVQAQGAADHYKITLRDASEAETYDGSFENIFKVNTSSQDFEMIDLPLSDFKFYFRGRLVPHHPELKTSNITSIGIQTFGGVYSDFKQSGTSSLKIDYIKAIGKTK